MAIPGWLCKLQRILKPNDMKYFELLSSAFDCLERGARDLETLVKNPTDENRATLLASICVQEERNDSIICQIHYKLDHTFVMPVGLDHEDVDTIATLVGRAMDYIKSATVRIHGYQINEADEIMIQMATYFCRAVIVVNKIFQDMKINGFNLLPEQANKYLQQIRAIEKKVDEIRRASEGEAFAVENPELQNIMSEITKDLTQENLAEILLRMIRYESNCRREFAVYRVNAQIEEAMDTLKDLMTFIRGVVSRNS